MIDVGKLNRRVTIQSRTSTKAGDTWADVRAQWASIVPIGASRLAFLAAQGSKVSHLIVFRETPAVSVGQRIVFGGANYQVESVQTFLGDRQEVVAELVL